MSKSMRLYKGLRLIMNVIREAENLTHDEYFQ